MAEIPDTAGIPTVTPNTATPNRSYNIQANPAEFGGLIAQGEEKLGAGASQAGDFFGQVQTDDAVNGAMQKANGIVENFRSLKGADALNAQQSTQDQLDAAFSSAREGLGSPKQQFQFDQISRMYRERYIAGMVSSHAVQQGQVYANGVNKDSADVADNLIAAMPNDPDNVTNATHDLRSAYIKEAQNTYGMGIAPGNPIYDDAIKKADQRAVLAQIRGTLPTNPAGAEKLFTASGNLLASAPEYDALAAHFQSVHAAQDLPKYIDMATRPAAEAASSPDLLAVDPTGAPKPEYLQKVAGAENPAGDAAAGPVVRNEAGQVIADARGKYQFTSTTWNGLAQQHPELNLTPVGNGQDGRLDNAQQDRAIVPYTQANAALIQQNGYQPTEANLRMAHFLGAQGAVNFLNSYSQNPDAPAAQTVAAQPGGALAVQANPGVFKPGATIGSVYDQMTAGFGKSEITAGKADARAAIERDYADNPPMMAKMLSGLNEHMATIQMANLANAQAQEEMAKSAASDYTSRMMTGQWSGMDQNGQPVSIVQQISADPRLAANPELKAKLWDMAETHAKRDVGHDPATYGTGYYDALSKLTLPADDPARISSVAQLVNRAGAGGDLTAEGVSQLTKTMNDLKKPEGTADTAIQKGALEYAKRQLSFEADYGNYKILDPKGEDAFSVGFIPAFYKAWNAGVAAGKDPAEFMSREKIDALVAPLKRQAAQLTKDQAEAGLESIGTAGAAAAVDLNAMTKQEDIVSAYQAGHVSRDAALKALRDKGFAKPSAPAPQPGPAAPPVPMGGQ